MVVTPAPAGSDVDSVHPLVRKTAAWSWRLLVIGAAVLAVIWIVSQIQMIVVSPAIAVIVTALLLPPVDWLDRHGLPRGFGVALVLLGGTAVLGGVLTFVISQFIAGLPALGGEGHQECRRRPRLARRWSARHES